MDGFRQTELERQFSACLCRSQIGFDVFEPEKAIEYFERLYAEDVDYRNVIERLSVLRESLQTA